MVDGLFSNPFTIHYPPPTTMMFLGLAHEAFVSIAASRLRTFLAMLGIVIGVSSVVLMVAVGVGSRKAIEASVAKLGTNLLVVTPGSRETSGLRNTDFSDLTVRDALVIATLPSVELSAPATRGRAFQIAFGSANWNTQVTGVTADFFPIRKWEFSDGEAFSESDDRLGSRVAVVGSTIVKELFAGEVPVGRYMRINSLPFKVVGVLESKGQGLDGRDQDDTIFVPFSTAQRKLFGTFQPQVAPLIFAQATSRETIEVAVDEMTELLRERHRIRPAEGDPFTIRNLTAITQTATETARALSVLLGAIASISLVVGGIGIMNIMLVTVTERTREIGIRKAIGATRSHIMIQFLLESIMISAIGSIIGLGLGAFGSFAARKWGGMEAELNMWSVVLALSVAVGVGVLSGLYPARRASRLQPVEALRSIGA